MTGKGITLSQIRDRVETKFDLNLIKRTRKREFTYPRAIYFALCRKHTVNTIEEIGESVNRHHSTVLNAINYTMNDVAYEPKYRVFYEELDRELDGQLNLVEQNKLLQEKVDRLEKTVNELTKFIIKKTVNGVS